MIVYGLFLLVGITRTSTFIRRRSYPCANDAAPPSIAAPLPLLPEPDTEPEAPKHVAMDADCRIQSKHLYPNLSYDCPIIISAHSTPKRSLMRFLQIMQS